MKRCARCQKAARHRYLVEMVETRTGKSSTYPSYICEACKDGAFENKGIRFYVGKRIRPQPHACDECGQRLPAGGAHMGDGGWVPG